jgi:hypothetical protein
MPIIVFPVNKRISDDDSIEVMAIIEIINQRGIQGMSSTNKTRIHPQDF